MLLFSPLLLSHFIINIILGGLESHAWRLLTPTCWSANRFRR